MNYKEIIQQTTGTFNEKKLLDLYGGDLSLWKKEIIFLHKQNKLRTHFRLNSVFLYEDYDNDWVFSIGEISKLFKIKNSKDYIDGSELFNIEISFSNLI